MKALIQRVRCASLTAEGAPVCTIGRGLCVYLGVAAGDGESCGEKLAAKIAKLRIFEDESGKLNRSALDCGAEILAVSNFTLCADCLHGNRPSFAGFSEAPERADDLYRKFCEGLERLGLKVCRGVFGADMQVEQVCDGPVNIVLDSADFGL